MQTRTKVDVPTQATMRLRRGGEDGRLGRPVELRVVAQVSPTEASCVVASVGTLKKSIVYSHLRSAPSPAMWPAEVTKSRKRASDRNRKPVLNSEGKPIFVTVNRPTKVLDLINQRPLIEGEIERRIRLKV